MITRSPVVPIVYLCLTFASPLTAAEAESHGPHGHYIEELRGGQSSMDEQKAAWRRAHRHSARWQNAATAAAVASGIAAGASTGAFNTESTNEPQTQMPSNSALAAAVFTQLIKNRLGNNQNSDTAPARKTVLPGAAAAEGEDAADDSSTPAEAKSGSSGFQSAAEAQAEVAQDLASCRSTQSTATQCCNNPMSCSGSLDSKETKSLNLVSGLMSNPPSKGGVTDYCQRMNQLGGDTENLNVGFANICFDSHMGCTATCEDLASKYAQRLASCDGCEAQSIYESARRQLSSTAKSCDALTDKTTQLASNGFGAIVNQNAGQYCNQVGGVNAGAITAAQAAKVSPPASGPLLASAVAEDRVATGGIDGSPARKKATDLSVDAANGFKGYAASKGTPTQAPTKGATAIKTASATPTQAPKQGAAPVAAAPVSAPAAPAKIEAQAARQPASENDKAPSQGLAPKGSAPAAEEVVPIAGNDSQFNSGTDLRQFLPGGSRAAGRRLAGASEINPKEEDIFLRISNKIMEKCRLGILWECR